MVPTNDRNGTYYLSLSVVEQSAVQLDRPNGAATIWMEGGSELADVSLHPPTVVQRRGDVDLGQGRMTARLRSMPANRK